MNHKKTACCNARTKFPGRWGANEKGKQKNETTEKKMKNNERK